MAKVDQVQPWQRAIVVLSGTVVGTIALLALQWGRPVLIPISLALLFTFLLNPIVRSLQRRGLGRGVAVVSAVSMAILLLTCLGWMMTRQVGGMLAELPQNTTNIKAKVKTLKELGSGHLADQLGQMIEEISLEFQAPPTGQKLAIKEDQVAAASPSTIVEEPALLRSPSVFWLSLTGYLGSAFEVLATLAFATVLLIFFLLGREDLRDRVVLLAGKARLTLTSKALEDVTERISRYLMTLAIVNGSFGVVLTVGLLLFQLPYALLWGCLAAALRFIPYIGPWVGAIFPFAMSIAAFEGWGLSLAILGYVVALEVICNNVVEPLAFGRSTGVSPTALLISAAFWLYLWGPIGLVLSAPFAVCLVVLGKNIPQLAFLNLLLGDSPALRADVGLYQRLMLGDEQEATSLVEQRLRKAPADTIYDEVFIPALNYAKRDGQRNHLTDEDQRLVLRGMQESLLQTDNFCRPRTESDAKSATTAASENEVVNDSYTPIRILGCPATDETDALGLEMLRQLLNPARWELKVVAVQTLTSEIMIRIAQDPPAIVCIAALPPGGMAHARYLCKRLRSASPDVQIIVGRWGRQRNDKVECERLEQAGATFVTTTLLETRQLLESRLPLIPRITKTHASELEVSMSQ